ncbi:hypothetical protein FOA52_010090 [Chlamydomonas sp. UWO 241]|nr:hypothetical protein FOA52_010090 [Chlamydomonas sp. UWO 241]
MQTPRAAGDVAARPALAVPAFSSRVAATLGVIDISGCVDVRSIDFVRSCVQLRCLWMPGCVGVSDLLPLGACSETLEELWLAGNGQFRSLALLKACPRLRKLDLTRCHSVLADQVENLRLSCTELAAPSSVKLQG